MNSKTQNSTREEHIRDRYKNLDSRAFSTNVFRLEERNALMLDNFQLTGRARSNVVPEETIEEEEFQFGGS